MKSEIVLATDWHALEIAATARKADIDELWAGSRATPLDCMTYGMRYGARVGLIDGRPACMFGVMPYSIIAGHGIPWLVASSLLDAHPKALLRHSRAEFWRMATIYRALTNAVDDRNEAAKRWLLWLGFQLGPPVPYGIDALPFRHFRWDFNDAAHRHIRPATSTIH